ncbi:DUF2332 domain-containing protein [Novosphingobium cyanobacteriorum]|uniref:DUF2332 family protein n=1 Tax=Novosphingobium cyanobacteriorum TaxID=3024215 RepID=A0ABT6CG34_9SPHN|nr:DUF2332 family protein [Novosphingobium cyanobacteriorum]MDF8332787.1 DUF2332 family protein [Novosphingobium cyanobacteriorum]
MLIAATADPVHQPDCLEAPVSGRAIAQLGIEAAKARRFGKFFVAALLESVARVLPQAPSLARAVETWPGDLAKAGVIFRLNAGLHAMARSGRHPGLAAIYRDARTGWVPEPLLLDITLSLALHDGEADLLTWMAGPTQTNEVARVAGLAAVLMELDARAQMRTCLLELGSSAGLNLNLERYNIRLGAQRAGDSASEVCIAPSWAGRLPLGGRPHITSAIGVDLNPLDVRNDADSERLHAYIWPGEIERTERLRAAIALARVHSPSVEKGRAGEWLVRQLALPQSPGERRVVFHSMVMQYLPEAEHMMIDRALAEAGRSASVAAPLVRVGLEWNADRTAVELTVSQWNGQAGSGRPAVVAICHPYAEWFEWTGLSDRS